MSAPRMPSQIVAGMLADLHPQVRWTEAAGFPCAGSDGLIVAFEQFTDTAMVAQAAAGKELP